MSLLAATTTATRYLRHGHTCLAVAGPGSLTLTTGNGNDSLLWSRNSPDTDGTLHTWSPYGTGKPQNGLPGFNGERSDPLSGCFHLGNGYRAYNPVLRRFNCPDSLSPFGAGGINPYTYCAGDPVNNTDPSGHVSWQGILGIVTGAIGLILTGITAGASLVAAGSISAAVSAASSTTLVAGAAGLAADVTAIASGAVEESDPGASSALGWISMATGIAGMVAGTAVLGMAATGGMRQVAGSLGRGLNGGGSVAARRWASVGKVETLQFLAVESLHGEIPNLQFPHSIYKYAHKLRRLESFINSDETALSKLRVLSVIHAWRKELNIRENYLYDIFSKLRFEHIEHLDNIARTRGFRGVESDFAFLPGVGINEYYRPSKLLTHGYNSLNLLVIDSQNKVMNTLTLYMQKKMLYDIFEAYE